MTGVHVDRGEYDMKEAQKREEITGEGVLGQSLSRGVPPAYSEWYRWLVYFF